MRIREQIYKWDFSEAIQIVFVNVSSTFARVTYLYGKLQYLQL
jgi:hypothetical protein